MVLGSSSHGGERKGLGTSPYTPVSGDHMWVGPGVGGTRGGPLTMRLRPGSRIYKKFGKLFKERYLRNVLYIFKARGL